MRTIRKHISAILVLSTLLISTIFSLSRCTSIEDSKWGSFPYLEIAISDTAISSDSHDFSIGVDTKGRNYSANITSGSEWIEIAVSSGRLSVSVTENDMESSRQGIIELSTVNATITKSISIFQDESGENTFSGDLILRTQSDITDLEYTRTLGSVVIGNIINIQTRVIDDVLTTGIGNNIYSFETSDISDISGLEKIHTILGKKLIVLNTPLDQLPEFIKDYELDSLFVEFCSLTDLSDILPLTSLKTLSVKGNGVTDLTGISSLTLVEYLDIANNGITDISALEDMTGLKTLILGDSDNAIYVEHNYNFIEDFSVLASLTNLEKLVLNGMPLTQSQIDQIKTLLPQGCILEAENMSGSPIPVLGTLNPIRSFSDVSLRGTILSEGKADLERYGFLIGTTSVVDDMTFIEVTTDIDANGIFNYTAQLNDFADDTYYICAVAGNSYGMGQGEIVELAPDVIHTDVYLKDKSEIDAFMALGMTVIDANLILGDIIDADDGASIIMDINGESKIFTKSILANDDLAALSGLEKIKSLYLVNSDINSIDILFPIKIYSVVLKGNAISSIPAGLKDSEVELLNVSRNKMKDISAVRNMFDLKELYLGDRQNPEYENNIISDYEPVLQLQNLKILDISGLHISSKDISSIESALPNATIYKEGLKESLVPVISTKDVVFDQSGSTFTLSGKLNSEGGSAITIYGFYWGTDKENLQFVAATDISGDEFSVELDQSLITSGTSRYYYRAYAENNDGGSFGETKSWGSNIANEDIILTSVDDINAFVLREISVINGKLVIGKQTYTSIEGTIPVKIGNDIEYFDKWDLGDFSFLKDLEEVSDGIYIINTDLNNISSFNTTLSTSKLVLKGNNLTSLPDLSFVNGLEVLNVSINKMSNIDPVVNLADLKELYLGDRDSYSLENNTIAIYDVLYGLKSLEKLDVSGLQISPAQISLLESELPDCDIISEGVVAGSLPVIEIGGVLIENDNVLFDMYLHEYGISQVSSFEFKVGMTRDDLSYFYESYNNPGLGVKRFRMNEWSEDNKVYYIQGFATNNEGTIATPLFSFYNGTIELASQNDVNSFTDIDVDIVRQLVIGKRTYHSDWQGYSWEHSDISNISSLKGKIKDVARVTIHDTNVSKIDILGQYKRIGSMFLSNNRIVELPQLNLRYLETLFMSDNLIRDISPLLNLQNLTALSLSGNSIENGYLLSNLKKLYQLSVDSCGLESIDFVNELSSLALFDASNNKISSLPNLGPSIWSLDLRNNHIRDISSLASNSNIYTLYISGNLISDISPLSYMSSLHNIYLGEHNTETNYITDLSPLYNLSSLSYLYANYLPVSQTQIDELYNRFPDITISSVGLIEPKPRIITDKATNVTSNSATLNAKEVVAGASAITAYGFEWGTSANNLSNVVNVTSGIENGKFSADITELEANKIYFYRAFATNSIGTAYGEIISLGENVVDEDVFIASDLDIMLFANKNVTHLNGAIVIGKTVATPNENTITKNIKGVDYHFEKWWKYDSDFQFLSLLTSVRDGIYVINTGVSEALPFNPDLSTPEMSFRGNSLNTIPDLSFVDGLKILDVSSNYIWGISDLSGMNTTLSELYLGDKNEHVKQYARIDDYSVLKTMSALSVLDLSGLAISQEEVDDIAAALPDATVISENLKQNTPVVETAPEKYEYTSYTTVYINVINYGRSDITEFGFYWGDNPNNLSTKVVMGSYNASGLYNQNIYHYDNTKRYYYKAYATNKYGTSYGETRYWGHNSISEHIEIKNQSTFNSVFDLGLTKINGNLIIGNKVQQETETSVAVMIDGSLCHFEETDFTDISEINSLDEVTGGVYIINANVTDLSFLTNIKTPILVVKGNNIDKMADISYMNNILRTLNISTNKMRDITEVGKLTSLEYLYLGDINSSAKENNEIANFLPLKGMNYYLKLDLSGLPMSDKQIVEVKSYIYQYYITANNMKAPLIPTVVTSTYNTVNNTTVRLNGTISNNGKTEVTEYGILWGVSSDAITNKVTGTNISSGNYSVDITVEAGVTYYYRAYATNSYGTDFGDIRAFIR